MASESKKEAFRKYLESSGVLDALTKVGDGKEESASDVYRMLHTHWNTNSLKAVLRRSLMSGKEVETGVCSLALGCPPRRIRASVVLVALYEEHDKPPIAIEFVRKALGGPTVAEYEQLTNEKNEFVAKYDALCVEHEEACRKLNELLPPPPPPLPPEMPADGEVPLPEGSPPAGSPPTPLPPAPAKQSGAAPAGNAKSPAGNAKTQAAPPPAPAKSEKPAKSAKA